MGQGVEWGSGVREMRHRMDMWHRPIPPNLGSRPAVNRFAVYGPPPCPTPRWLGLGTVGFAH